MRSRAHTLSNLDDFNSGSRVSLGPPCPQPLPSVRPPPTLILDAKTACGTFVCGFSAISDGRTCSLASHSCIFNRSPREQHRPRHKGNRSRGIWFDRGNFGVKGSSLRVILEPISSESDKYPNLFLHSGEEPASADQFSREDVFCRTRRPSSSNRHDTASRHPRDVLRRNWSPAACP